MWIRALIVLAALLVPAPAAQADEVRMFAVGNKHRIQDAVTHADYRNKMAALMDAGFPNRSAYVQAGVDDVASHLRPADPRGAETGAGRVPRGRRSRERPDRRRAARSPAAQTERAQRDHRPCSSPYAPPGRATTRTKYPGAGRGAARCSWR